MEILGIDLLSPGFWIGVLIGYALIKARLLPWLR
jgi:hypothetical protein